MNKENQKPTESKRLEVATLAGGCFWCTEAVFKQLKGVEQVVPGYAGGKLEKPTYEEVSTGRTGHAETVEVTFDPQIISYREILQIFFASHDPTTLNRQGADIGTQYRSIIFYHNIEQKRTAEEVIKELTPEFDSPIVTEVKPFEGFYEAEEYHKNFFQLHPEQAYCRIVITPKIAKLQKLYLSKLKLQV